MTQDDGFTSTTQASTKTMQSTVHPVPKDALDGLDADISEAGGEFKIPTEYEGAAGRTMFDTSTSKDGTVTVLLPPDNLEQVPRQSLVRIRSVKDSRVYLGAVVEGPFAEPDGLRADSPIIVSVNIKGQGTLMPKYHGRVHVQIMSEELPDGTTIPPRRRPLPNSAVFMIGSAEAAKVLQLEGDVTIGTAFDQEGIEVKVPSQKKSLFPRHLGVLGTTGGGKSTTVAGLVEQLQRAGTSIVLLDTEGEYLAIDRPADDSRMVKALERRGLKPKGIENTHIYHLVGTECGTKDHHSITSFRLNFSDISASAFNEILEFSSAQETRFFVAYNVCKQLLRVLKQFPATPEDEQTLLNLDELEGGYPTMKLSHMISVASAFLHHVSHAKGEPRIYSDVFKANLPVVMKAVAAANSDSDSSWRALLQKLWRLHRFKIFDNPAATTLDFSTFLQAGRVNIIDLSDMDSPQVRNVVIAQILRGIQKQQDQNYQAAQAAGVRPTPTMVFIEEAHEFLSSQRIRQMSNLFEQVAKIARRGRKRWLGMVFISQLPQHLPDEVLSLINNWILHKISDANVVSRLRRSVGGIDDALWNRLVLLAQGQAIASFTSFARPLQVNIDPAKCKLLMID